MYANIEEVWDNNNTLPLFSTYNHHNEFDNQCEIKEYKSLNKRIDNNILIDDPPISSNKMMMGTPIRRNKNNYNRFHQEKRSRSPYRKRYDSRPEQPEIEYENDFEPYHENNDYRFNEIEYGSNKQNRKNRRRKRRRREKVIENFYMDHDEYSDHDLSDIDDLYDDQPTNVIEKESSCTDHLKHILKCKICYKIMQKKFGKKNQMIKKQSSLLDNFFTDDVKEILMVIVIGIFIILILDIFLKIIEKK